MKPLVSAALALCCACTAIAPQDPLRSALVEASTNAESGAIEATLRSCDRVLARAARSRSGGAPERFVAALLAARALSNRIEQPDEVESWVMFRQYAALARRAASELALEDVAALDAALEVERLDWIETASHARMGFTTSIAALCRQRPQLLDPAETRRVLEALQLPPRVAAWALVGLFRVVRDGDEPLALRLATAALDRGAANVEDFAELEQWLEDGSPSEFHCPKCDHVLVARLRACPNDQTPNGEFRGRPRKR
ncbi:MAG: hypothetical protein IT454_02615 [Planctomycetes bacterium]|nr:hypothetical protein [Planctomycetota bacterium]